MGGLGNGAKLSKVMFDVAARAHVAQPLLEFSERRLEFEYVHVAHVAENEDAGLAKVAQYRPLSIRWAAWWGSVELWVL